ncbi:MAG: YcxB family protein [Candidatus Acidiferrales bacterium]
MTDIRARFTYTPEEYAEAQRAYSRHMASCARRLFVPVILVIGILFLLGGVYRLFYRSDALWTIFDFVYGGFVVIYYGPLRAWRFKRDFLKAKTLQGEKTVVLNEESICISGAFGESKINWTAFGKYAETPNLFVLFTPPRVFYMLPKHAFSQAGQAAIRQLLAQKIGANKS